jgi:hypothetical protein
MPAELETMTRWVALLAVASAVQTLLLLGAAIAGWLAWRRAMTSIEQIETRHLAPISARVAAVVDDLQDVTSRIRRADDMMKHKLQEVGGAARFAKDVLAERAWPAMGVVRAVSAGLRALSRPPVPDAAPRRVATVAIVGGGPAPGAFDARPRAVERPTPG